MPNPININDIMNNLMFEYANVQLEHPHFQHLSVDFPDETPEKPSIMRLLRFSKTSHPYPDFLFGIPKDDTISNDSFIGVEVEVEGIINQVDIPYLWDKKEDGSLRNNGIEYVTYPTPAKNIPYIFETLQKALKEKNTPVYSNRTSTHVHINVKDITVEQLKAFVLLYLCFEKVLFKFAGGGRENSIFCVPLSHAGYIKTLKQLFNCVETDKYEVIEIVSSWHKYTSLNLKTIRTFGTIEFRHLPGTDDPIFFTNWIKLLLNLKENAIKYSVKDLYKKIVELNSNSEYEIFTSSIFGNNRYLLYYNLQELMENDVTHIKECFSEHVKKQWDSDLFKKSSFFLIHKFKERVLTPLQEKLKKLSIEELQEELIRLRKDYSNSHDVKEQETIVEIYREVEVMLSKKRRGV